MSIVQVSMLKDYCAPNVGIDINRGGDELKTTIYNCAKVDGSIFNEKSNDESKWRKYHLTDYCKFRMKFFDVKDGKIAKLFEENGANYSNIEKYFTFSRSNIGFIGNNNDPYFATDFSKFKAIVNELLNQPDFEFKYFVLLNGISSILSQYQFNSTDNIKHCYGFDAIFKKFYIKYMGSKASSYTEVFQQATKDAIEKILTDNFQVGVYFKENQEKNKFYQCIFSCWKNSIPNVVKYYQFLSQTEKNINGDGIYCGIKQFIVHELTYEIAKALFTGSKGTASKENKQNRFYHYIWDLSVYLVCCPRWHYIRANNKSNPENGDIISSSDESFYISCFLRLFNTCFNTHINSKSKDKSIFTTTNIGSYNILHIATRLNMKYYCELLTQKLNGKVLLSAKNKFGQTSLDIAKQKHFNPIISVLKPYVVESSQSKDEKEKERENADEDLISSSQQASKIESTHLLLKKQLSFAKYFLLYFGCAINDKQYGPNSDDTLLNQLFVDCSQFSLKQKQTFNNSKESNNAMKSIVQTLISLIKAKMPISDEVLVLCFAYCNELDNELLNELIESLTDACDQCLNSNYYSTNDSSINTQLRDYYWFKQFLLFSNSMLLKIQPSNVLMYDYIEKTVGKALVSQKEFIWKQVESEKQQNSKDWNRLVAYNANGKKINIHKYKLRQDSIPNGMKLDWNKEDLWIMSPLVDRTSNYQIFEEYNSKAYLTKLLIVSNAMNVMFQSDMKKLFGQIEQKINKSISFQAAPVKKYDRCIVKSNTDYQNEEFPSCASIVDLLRCSVCFNDVETMLQTLDAFCDLIYDEKCSFCVTEIIRVKNGFNDIVRWKSENDANYCDVKLNVIIFDKQTNRAILGEIQFLLKWLLKAKKMLSL